MRNSAFTSTIDTLDVRKLPNGFRAVLARAKLRQERLASCAGLVWGFPSKPGISLGVARHPFACASTLAGCAPCGGMSQPTCPPTPTSTTTPTHTPTDSSMRCNLPGQLGTCASAVASAPTLTPCGLLGASVLPACVAGLAVRRRMRSR